MTVLLALLIGASLAALGAGGSVVTVPALVYGAGLDAHAAAGTSLLVVGLVAFGGFLAKRRLARPRMGLIFGAAGMAGTLPGAWLNHHLPTPVIMLGFALVVLGAAWRMARTRTPETPAGGSSPNPRAALLVGAIVGLGTGLFGVGGGFLIVPALTLLLGLEMPAAVATSLLVIALNSLAGLAVHAGYGSVSWGLGFSFAAVAFLGAGLVLPFAARLHPRGLQRTFALLLATIGIGTIVQTIGRAFA